MDRESISRQIDNLPTITFCLMDVMPKKANHTKRIMYAVCVVFTWPVCIQCSKVGVYLVQRENKIKVIITAIAPEYQASF